MCTGGNYSWPGVLQPINADGIWSLGIDLHDGVGIRVVPVGSTK